MVMYLAALVYSFFRAIVGKFFIALLVARLVSMYGFENKNQRGFS